MVNFISGLNMTPPQADPVALPNAPAEAVSAPVAVMAPKLDDIAAAIRASGKPPSAFFTVRGADGSRLCHIGGQGIRVSEAAYLQILSALQPATGTSPEQIRIWNLQRRAGGRD